MNTASLVVAGLALLVALLALLVAAVANRNSFASYSKSRIAQLDASMTELLDSYQALLDSHKKLRSRIGMRELRERKEQVHTARDTVAVDGDVPDWRTDPQGYKRAMRQKLKLGRP